MPSATATLWRRTEAGRRAWAPHLSAPPLCTAPPHHSSAPPLRTAPMHRPFAPPLCRQAVETEGGRAMEPRAHRLLRGGSLPLLHAAQGAAPAAARSHRAVQGVRCATAARRGQRDVRRLVGALTARAVRRAYTAVPGQEWRPGSDNLRGENDRAATAGAPRASRSSHCPARRVHAARPRHARCTHAAGTSQDGGALPGGSARRHGGRVATQSDLCLPNVRVHVRSL